MHCDDKEVLIADNSSANLLSVCTKALFTKRGHDTTYKYCLFKCILDNIFEVDENDLSLSFKVLNETAAEIYWNLISVYKIPQRAKAKNERNETIKHTVDSFIEKHPYTKDVLFESLKQSEQKEFIKKFNFLTYPVGSFCGDTDAMLYGFSKKNKKIYFNETSINFLRGHKVLLEQLNYYQWLKLCESFLSSFERSVENLSQIFELVTERKDLSKFKAELLSKGDEKVCFYSKEPCKKATDLDHVIPWSFLKRDDLWNLVWSCKHCNCQKNNRMPVSEYFDKLVERNTKLNIESPDILKIREIALANGISGDYIPK